MKIVKEAVGTAFINGVKGLKGATVSAPDLRAGAALVLAALSADGTTVMDDIRYIERGYEDFDEKVRNLGGIMEVITDEKEITKFKMQAV